MPNSTKKPKSYTFVINGEDIEVCAKTISFCSKIAHNVLSQLRSESRKKTGTLRIYYGSIIMLNLITNAIIAKSDNLAMKRILKPTESLVDDYKEYKEERMKKVKILSEALSVATDNTLPLDYSHELEKYFVNNNDDDNENKDTDTNSENEKQDDVDKSENTQQNNENKNNIQNNDVINKDNQNDADISKQDNDAKINTIPSYESEKASFNKDCEEIDISSMF